MRKYWWPGVVFLVLGDCLAKRLMIEYYQLESWTLWEGILAINYVENHGMISGLRQGCHTTRQILLIVNVGLAVFFIGELRRTEDNNWFRCGSMLALAGIIGNLIDRLTYGYVIDFIDLCHFVVINVADIFLTLSIFLILKGCAVDRQY